MNLDDLELLIAKAKKTHDKALLKLVNEYLSNPLYTFEPRPDQPALFDEQEAFCKEEFQGLAVALGGNGSGKSYSAAYKVAKLLLNTPPPRPNCPYWVIAPSYDLASGVCWATHLTKFITPEYIKHIAYHSRAKGWAESVVLKPHANGNNFVIEFKSSDQERRRLQGSSIFGMWCDEQIPHEILMEVWARCREYDQPGSMLYTLTPLAYDPKLEEIFNNRTTFPNWKFYRLNSSLNDRLAKGFMERLIESELDEKKETRMTGAFATYYGCVYAQFNTGIHVVDSFPIPEHWQKFRGLDFGYSNPTAMVWVAKDPDSQTYYVYDEYYQDKASMDEHCEAINKKPWGDSQYYGVCYSDHQAAQERHEYSLRGIPSQPADKNVMLGIASVQRLLRVGVDGKPKLYFFDNCVNLVKEIRSYRWHPQLDRPIKEKDHVLDALRYALHSDYKCSAGNPWTKRKPC